MKAASIKVYTHIFFFKQKTAYEMRESDWSSDVCSSDLSDCSINVCDLSERECAYYGDNQNDKKWLLHI